MAADQAAWNRVLGALNPPAPALRPPSRVAGTRFRTALRGALGEIAIGPLQGSGLDGWKHLRQLFSPMLAPLARDSLKAAFFPHVQSWDLAT